MIDRARPMAGVVDLAKQGARRIIDWVVTMASTSYHGRWYYANRWHPHTALMQQALDQTVDYINTNMPEAMIRRDAHQVIRSASKMAKLDGLYLEFGVRSGASVNHIARMNRARTVYGFDSFEGLPEPWTGWTMDAGAMRHEGLPTVESNVELVVGWFDDTLPSFLERHDGIAAFVHVDSDIYSSARTILTNLAPRIRPGTIIVFNEYFNYPNWQQHEYRAFQEFCAERSVEYAYRCWGMYEVTVEITAVGAPGDRP